jgi:hypothetical protein
MGNLLKTSLGYNSILNKPITRMNYVIMIGLIALGFNLLSATAHADLVKTMDPVSFWAYDDTGDRSISLLLENGFGVGTLQYMVVDGSSNWISVPDLYLLNLTGESSQLAFQLSIPATYSSTSQTITSATVTLFMQDDEFENYYHAAYIDWTESPIGFIRLNLLFSGIGGFDAASFDAPPTVPIPGTLLMLGTGLIGLLCIRRRITAG